ncbi:MAG TPA: acyl-CoA synthetase [Burkholderiaceae bacterium]|nr:acyl-CoA synthetase [Burkholderiaceae bacterium]
MPNPPSDAYAAPIRTIADVERVERTPWQERIPAQDTYSMLRAACQRWPHRVALRLLLAGAADAPVRSVCYDELLQGVHRTANALHACGVRRDVAVAILLPNIVEGHFALWGAEAAGVASPINPLLDPGYIARICAETGAQVLVALGPAPGSDIWDKAVDVTEQAASVHTLLQVDLAAALGHRAGGAAQEPRGRLPRRAGVRVLDFHAALAAADSTELACGRRPEGKDPCAYFHTGGTTGYPKIAVHRHLNESFLAWVLQAFDDRAQVMLAGLPLFHVNGALITGLWAFCTGSEVVMLTPGGYRTPGVLDHFWGIARRFDATTFSAVPTILAALAAKPLPEGGIPSLRHVLCGAAPLPRQVAIDFERAAGVHIHEGYGLTEGTCVSTVNPPCGERQPGSVGIRLPYQELQLFALGADAKPGGSAQPGEAGVIAIRGPNVFAGYLRERDNRDIWIADGWFNTGDLGRIGADGRLTLCGRAKDLIIRGGHNIDPSMIEDALNAHPSVALAAAVGQPDRNVGELPVAYVAVKPGVALSGDALREEVRGAIPERAAVPVRIEVLPSLPLTAIGKVSKPHLRLLAVDHVLREALFDSGLGHVRARARLCPEQGTVVDLTGPAEARSAAIALAGLYPVTPHWQETNP